MGWFILMEIISAACIGAYWFDTVRHDIRPWDHVGLGAIITVPYIVSNLLLVRQRRWAVAGLIVCWLLLAVLLLPSV